MASYYFIQVFDKGLFEDKAECYTKEDAVFKRMQELLENETKFSLYAAECKIDLT